MEKVVPYLTVDNASAAIEFYKKAFNATEVNRQLTPDGNKIMHAELMINGSSVMLSDDFSERMSDSRTPKALGGTPVVLHMNVNDADKTFNQAVQCGATVAMPLEDTFWGDRYGQIADPFGHVWSISTPQRQVSEEEMMEGARKAFSS